MNVENLQIPREDVQKLLGAASGDAALLYIFLKSGNALADAADALRLNEARMTCAVATLRQLGLWQDTPKTVLMRSESPVYTEQDVLNAGNDPNFRRLTGEVQRRLGRILTTEEMK